MTKQTAETILKSCFLALSIFILFYTSITKDKKIQDLEHELLTTKTEHKQKCNERFLGVKNDNKFENKSKYK